MKRAPAVLAGLGLAALSIPLIAQDNQPTGGESLLETLARAAQLDADSQRSGLISFVENQISTPDRQIRLTGIDGVLSSNAAIEQITVSDTEGIYLIIQNVRLVWNQAGLIFGRLEIESLSADSIVYARNPVSTEPAALPSPEAGGFSVPELPVAVILEQLNVPVVRFGEGVFGLESQVSVNGAVTLDGGALDATLDVVRLDGPGGALDLDVTYANNTQTIDLDLTVTEPENGIIANLLNIEGRPDIGLSLSGQGQLTNLTTQLALDAGGQRVLSGTGLVVDDADGLSIDADVSGPIADILPAAYRDFFGAETALSFDVQVPDSGGIVVPQFSLSGGQLSLTGEASTSDDGFLNRLVLNGEIASPGGEPVILPVPGASTSVQRAAIAIDFGTEGGDDWSSDITLTGFSSPEFSAETIALQGNGIAANLDDPETRRVTFNGDGTASGLNPASEEIAQALGNQIGLGVAGIWEAGQPIELAQLRILGEALTLDIAGSIDGTTFDGSIDLDTASLAPFSGLAGRPLTGAADLDAVGQIALATGGFDLTLSGTATDLTIDEPTADALLAGTANLSGRIARDETGLTAENLILENPQLRLAADGTYATGAADFRFDAALADLALLTPEASGRLTASGTATGSDGIIDLAAQIAVPQGTLAGRTLQNAQIAFDGTTAQDGLIGDLTGTAFLDGFRIALAGGIDANAERVALTGISFEAPGAQLTGAVTRTTDGLLTGTLALDAPDVSTAAALALVDAAGGITANVILSTDAGQQNAEITAGVDGFTALDVTIGTADIDVDIADLFGVPAIDGTINGAQIVAGGVTVDTLRLAAQAAGDTTTFDGDAQLANGTSIDVAGSLAEIAGGFQVGLDTLSLQQGALSAQLQQPSTLSVQNETVSFDGLELAVGSGRVTISGTAGSTLDLSAQIASFPLSIANTIAPDLNVSGTLNGTVNVSGSTSAPQVAFAVNGSGLDAAAIASLGISPFAFSVDGTFADGTVRLASAQAQGASGLDLAASGTIPLSGPGLDLAIDGSAPLTLAQQFLGGRDTDLTGNIVFNITVNGSLDDPQIDGDIDLVEAQVYDGEFDIGLNRLNASVALTNDRAVIENLSASITGGGTVSARGTVPFTGAGLDIAITANAPLSLANRFVADRGAQLSGTATANARVTGSIANPQFSGQVSVAGGEYVDPGLNLRLVNIAGSASLAGDRAVINGVSANLVNGGAVSVAGSVTLDAALNADISVTLDSAQYTDGLLVAATLDGALSITGPITAGPLVAGNILIERAEIAVPETFGANANLIDVSHRNPPADVAATLARLRAQLGERSGAAGAPIRLNVTISAPNQVFIRGRGLDAELGGALQITGTTDNIIPVGGLELIRGRLEILGQRIDFESGTLTLVGDLDPFIDLVAVTEGEDITVFVTISGQVSAPQIEFGSNPMLPQDEVLARLLFNRGINELGPVQLAQLAGIAAQLVGGGGGGPSFLDSIRQAAGLDDLDIITDSTGNTAVRAGTYLDDNLYLSVEGGAGGGRVSIDLDLTNNLSARVTTGTDGNSSAGIFYEQDF